MVPCAVLAVLSVLLLDAWNVLRQAPKLLHGEHRVTANNGKKRGSEQRELVCWIFPGAEWESVTTGEVP